jgi:antirestriction protein
MSTDTPKVYVGTYAKYNEGSFKGAWVELEGHDEDSFYEACKELHSDESDPEYMFQDFENFPRDFYSESGLDSRVFEWLELDDDDRERAQAFLDCFGDCAGDLFQAAEDAYYGRAASDRDFAEELMESTGDLNQIPQSLRYYFDFEAYARDLMINDFSTSNGFYFISNW